MIFGAVNPSGRLAETIPVRIQDTAAYLNFPGEHSHVTYGEGIFVGYRWHDARDLPVSYPFGHGLSYTTFGYSGLRLTTTGDGIEVRVSITNTGDRAGREVVQAYAGLPARPSPARPARWPASPWWTWRPARRGRSSSRSGGTTSRTGTAALTGSSSSRQLPVQRRRLQP